MEEVEEAEEEAEVELEEQEQEEDLCEYLSSILTKRIQSQNYIQLRSIPFEFNSKSNQII